MAEKRCIKFEGYIYVPDKTDDYRALRNYSAKTMGRIRLFDETNQPNKHMDAFDNLGDMLSYIMSEYKKRALKRLPIKKRLI